MKKQLCEAGERAQRIRTLAASVQTFLQLPSPTWWLTVMYTASIGPDTLLWLLQALGMHVVHILAGKPSNTF